MGNVVVRNRIIFLAELLEKRVNLTLGGTYPKVILFHDVCDICVGLLFVYLKLRL
jgi:hypothetical protein